MTSRQRDSHTEDYSPKSIPAFNTAQERARYLVFAESTAEKMNSMLASHVFKMDNSYFKEAEPSIDKEQKKEAGVLGLLRAAEAHNPLDTRDSAIRSWW